MVKGEIKSLTTRKGQRGGCSGCGWLAKYGNAGGGALWDECNINLIYTNEALFVYR